MNLYKKLWVLAFIALTLMSFQQVPLKKTKLSDKITMSLPETFRSMTDDEVVSSYAVYRKPLAMYLDQRDQRCIWVLMYLLADGRILIWYLLKEFYKATILDLYTEVDFKKDEIIELDGKKFATFEFTSVVKPTDKEQSIVVTNPIKRYYYIQYTVVDGEVMIFNFNAPIRLQSYWSPIAADIMSSIKVK